MNFYKHHLGDYAQATAHLTFVEDAAYSRLLRKYYAEEQPIPAELKAAQRLVGARTRDEKDAVETVLEEFFELQEDGWHNKRADEELAKANAQAESNRKVAAEREARRRRAREADDTSTNRASDKNESSNESSASREPSQTPDTRHQTPEKSFPPSEPVDPEAPKPTQAGLACRLMREVGCSYTAPHHPDLLAALAEGVTPQVLADTAAEAIANGARKPFVYAIQTARGRNADGAKPIPQGNPNGHPQAQSGQPRISAVDAAAQRLERIAAEHDLEG